MFLVAHTMGIQHLGYTIINDGTKRDLWSSFRANLTAEDVRRMETYSSGWVPAEDAQLVGAVDAHAPVDIRMYDQAVQQFDAQLASLEPGVSALMREYVAMPDVAGWHGHKCVAVVCWVSVCLFSPPRVVHGQAAAKAVLVPVRAAHEQSGARHAVHAAAQRHRRRRLQPGAVVFQLKHAACAAARRSVTWCDRPLCVGTYTTAKSFPQSLKLGVSRLPLTPPHAYGAVRRSSSGTSLRVMTASLRAPRRSRRCLRWVASCKHTRGHRARTSSVWALRHGVRARCRRAPRSVL